MSASSANPGITDVPAPLYQPLPAVTKDLFVVHYSSDPVAIRENRVPAVSAILVQNVLSGTPLVFAAFTETELGGMPPARFLERFPLYEREMFRDFAEYTATHPEAIWVHWGMREAFFGFDVLNQRAKFHRQQYHGIEPERRFDLSHYLGQRYGDDFAPPPRLWNATRRNLGVMPAFLDDEATTCAWERGEHGTELRSLYAKVEAIARLFDRVRFDRFVPGAPEPNPSPDLKPVGTATTDPNDPAYFRRPQMDPNTHFNLSKMGPRHWGILAELFRCSAFKHKSRVKIAALAVGVEGANANPTLYKAPIAELADYELVETAVGQGGGVWLTRDGRILAESRASTVRTIAE